MIFNIIGTYTDSEGEPMIILEKKLDVMKQQESPVRAGDSLSSL